MKTSNPEDSRFVCRVVRFWNSADGASASHHVATCADCQRYFASCHDLDSALRGDAVQQRQEVPAGLESRIIRAVNASTVPAARPTRTQTGLLVFAGAAAAVAFAVVQFGPRFFPGHPAADPAVVALVASTDEAVPPMPTWLANPPSARELLEKNPLQKEVDCVYSDARSAVNFLAKNFLPNTPEPANGRSPRRATS